MIYLTQLIYIHSGQEGAFNEFEAVAIPLMAKYNGDMILRVRPSDESIIESSAEKPYEIHYLSFPSDQDLKNYLADEERQKFLHLKDQAIKSTVLVKGEKL